MQAWRTYPPGSCVTEIFFWKPAAQDAKNNRHPDSALSVYTACPKSIRYVFFRMILRHLDVSRWSSAPRPGQSQRGRGDRTPVRSFPGTQKASSTQSSTMVAGKAYAKESGLSFPPFSLAKKQRKWGRRRLNAPTNRITEGSEAFPSHPSSGLRETPDATFPSRGRLHEDG